MMEAGFPNQDKIIRELPYFTENDQITLKAFLELVDGMRKHFDSNNLENKYRSKRSIFAETYCVLETCANDELLAKNQRSEIHRCIGESFPFLSTEAISVEEFSTVKRIETPVQVEELNLAVKLPQQINVSEADQKFIKVKLGSECLRYLSSTPSSSYKPRASGFGTTSNERWSKNQPSYLTFHMMKTNKDTSEAIAAIAKAVGCKPKHFSFAGTKDKRGVTVQAVSGYKISKERMLCSLTRKEWDRNIKISDLHLSDKRVKLGSLKGNSFKIVIRNVPLDQVVQISPTCASFKSRPDFVNYFGTQRFGTKEIRTHEVGTALLEEDHERAVRLILGDARHRKQIKSPEKQPKIEFDPKLATHHYLYNDDIKQALKLLPRFMHLERSLLQVLDRDPKAFTPALQSLQKNSLAMYVHAAQSLIWNHAATQRIKTHGSNKIVIGDLVRAKGGPEITEEDNMSADEGDQGEEDNDEEREQFRVIEVKDEETAAQYSINDLLLPLPGKDVIYPPNLTDFYHQICSEHLGIGLEDFSGGTTRRLVPVLGGYRQVVVKAEDFDYKVLQPKEVGTQKTPLLASDLDRLYGRSIAVRDDFTVGLKKIDQADNLAAKYTAPSKEASTVNNDGLLDDEASPSAAVLISCSLPRSSYLTVMLRELLTDVSIAKIGARR